MESISEKVTALKFCPNLLKVLAFPQHPELQEFQLNPMLKQNNNIS